jgi:hypothetical protein
MQNPLTYTILLSLLLSCCAMEPAPPSMPTREVQALRLLMLLEEGQLEVWTQDSLSFTKWASFPLQIEADYPIGLFDILMENDSLRINFKNDFYEKKGLQIYYPFVKEKYTPLLSLLNSTEAEALSQISTLVTKINLLVVTNDIRNGGQFNPCRNCPSWIPELYSQLQLELMDFTKSKRSK